MACTTSDTCCLQVGDVLTPGQRREFVIIRDNGQDREIRLSLKQIEVLFGYGLLIHKMRR